MALLKVLQNRAWVISIVANVYKIAYFAMGKSKWLTLDQECLNAAENSSLLQDGQEEVLCTSVPFRVDIVR